MQLEFRRFRQEEYPEYAAWFVDPELNYRLGPMDLDWLDAVLAESEAEGITWSVYRGVELVAVIETVFDPQGCLPATLTGIATKPSRRGEGIGTAVLRHILEMHHAKGIDEHIAYVALDNVRVIAWLEQLEFAPTTGKPDKHGYIEFKHSKG